MSPSSSSSCPNEELGIVILQIKVPSKLSCCCPTISQAPKKEGSKTLEEKEVKIVHK